MAKSFTVCLQKINIIIFKKIKSSNQVFEIDKVEFQMQAKSFMNHQ
jgi:hypothetical protein